MSAQDNAKHWAPGVAPVAVVMISLNEAHNMEAVLSNLKGWAQEVFLVDSHSADETVSIALRHGVHVVQRRFRGFGDQWNFALRALPISVPWTMKLDPDERLSDELKRNLADAMRRGEADGFTMQRRLWFMGRPLPVRPAGGGAASVRQCAAAARVAEEKFSSPAGALCRPVSLLLAVAGNVAGGASGLHLGQIACRCDAHH